MREIRTKKYKACLHDYSFCENCNDCDDCDDENPATVYLEGGKVIAIYHAQSGYLFDGDQFNSIWINEGANINWDWLMQQIKHGKGRLIVVIGNFDILTGENGSKMISVEGH